MSQHRKHRGNRTTKVVADALKPWWPNALPTGAGRAGKDVTGVPFDVEVKARTAFQPLAWLRQATERAKGKELSFVVSRCNGQGEDAYEYLAFMRFGDLVQLLLKAGYGDIQTDTDKLEPERCTTCGSWKIKDVQCRTCGVFYSADL